MIESLGVIGTVLVASVTGSLHCAGMCGGLVLFAVGADGHVKRSAKLHVAYHGARGLAYTLLGAGAGALGAAADIGDVLGDNARLSAVIAGSLIVIMGVLSLATNLGPRGVRVPMPKWIKGLIESAHRRAFALPPVWRAAAVGGLTPLLPCGWLYAFVLVAAGTGHVWFGAAVMAAFWLGTVPVLAGLGFGVDRLTGSLRRHLPVVTSVLVIALGVVTAVHRAGLPTIRLEGINQASAAERANAAASLDHEQLPCCPLGASSGGGS